MVHTYSRGTWFRMMGGEGDPALCAVTNPKMSLAPSTNSMVSRNAVNLFWEPISYKGLGGDKY